MDRDNRRGVVAYLAERGVIPADWADLPITVEGEAWFHGPRNEAALIVRLEYSSDLDRRLRWVARYVRAARMTWRDPVPKWEQVGRIEIPAWDAST